MTKPKSLSPERQAVADIGASIASLEQEVQTLCEELHSLEQAYESAGTVDVDRLDDVAGQVRRRERRLKTLKAEHLPAALKSATISELNALAEDGSDGIRDRHDALVAALEEQEGKLNDALQAIRRAAAEWNDFVRPVADAALEAHVIAGGAHGSRVGALVESGIGLRSRGTARGVTVDGEEFRLADPDTATRQAVRAVDGPISVLIAEALDQRMVQEGRRIASVNYR